MISLYQWLIENKCYTEAEAEETILRIDGGLEIPIEIKNDIKEYWSTFFPIYKPL